MTKAEIQVRGILAGRTTREILDECAASGIQTGRETSKECVAWYRAHIKNRRLSRGLLAIVDAHRAAPAADGRPLDGPTAGAAAVGGPAAPAARAPRRAR